MRITEDINDWKERAVVATVGFFDGVHPGHRFLLNELQRVAKERHLPSAVITFPVHPRIVMQSDYQPKLLNTLDEKLTLLSKTGVDYMIVMDFTPELAALNAREFIIDVLSAQWRVKTLLVGYDHRFGHQRTDGFEQYAGYGSECGMEIIQASYFSGQGMAVSSSDIRRLLENGDVKDAAGFLGYRYQLKGHVVGGNQVGRSIGFPTANIAVDDPFKALPREGSYAVWVIMDGKRYQGMLYIGSRPTVANEGLISIEVNIFDFSDDVYHKQITVEFVDFIREDMKFDTMTILKEQMQKDKECALHLFKTENRPQITRMNTNNM